MNKNKKIVIVVVAIILIIIAFIVLLNGKKYTVTFDSNGGTKVETQIIKKGQNAKEPEKPTKEGYIFLGWYTDKDIKDKFDFNTKVKKDITLYAGWKEQKKEAKKVSILADKNEIMINEEVELLVEGMPEDGDTENLDIIWTSSDENIAKVDENGKVIGLQAGMATITVKVGEYTGSFVVNVIETTPEETTPTAEPSTKPSTRPSTKPATVPSTKPATVPSTKPATVPSTKPVTAPSTKPVMVPSTEPSTKPVVNPTVEPTSAPVQKITYTYSWEKVEESVAGQYRLFIVSSEGKKVSGTATITTKTGKRQTVSIPASGTVYVRNAISSVSNVKGN